MSHTVFARLIAGKSLDNLGLGEHEGRVDLRGIAAPPPEQVQRPRKLGFLVRELRGLLELRRARLVDLDLSYARLESLRFFHSRIENCRFDHAKCQDWRLWAVETSDTSLDHADLRSAVLGAWHEGKGNTYQRVTFVRANLGKIVCPAAVFIDCDFSDARMVKADFQSTSFIRCKFAGLLREVMFYNRGFQTGKPTSGWC